MLLKKKLGGMNEQEVPVTFSNPATKWAQISQKIVDTANVSVVPTVAEGTFKFVAKNFNDQMVLISVVVDSSGVGKCKVNCDNSVFGSNLLSFLRKQLESLA